MRHLLIVCVLLIIAVYSNAVSYSNEAEDEDDLSGDIDSPESIEDDTLDSAINNLYKRKSHEKHSKEKKKPHEHSKEKKKPHEHSKEKKSKEHEHSKEKKSKEHDHSKEKKSKERDHSKEKKSKERDHSKEKKSKERDHSKEKKSREKKSSREYTKRPTFLDDDVVLPHEKFCQYFYVFNGLEASIVSCSNGYRFDAKKLKCLKTKEVDCGKRKKNVDSSEEKKARINFKCPKWSGLHKHEYYCHLYYSCQNKRGRLFMCPRGMLFDDYNKKCSDIGKVDCNKRLDPNEDNQRPTIQPEVFVCPKSSGKYPHERDCSAFYKCDNRRYRIQHCPKGKLYHEYKRSCESEHKVTCGNRIHPDLNPDEPEDKVVDPNPNFNCRENFGRYNHDQYCNWYYQCHDRRPSVRECRRGWRYHSHGRRCRESREVTCDGKPDYEDATTEEITIFTEPETTPAPTEPETTPTPTEPETTTTPTEPETTTTPTEPETTTTQTEPETTSTPTEPDTTPAPTEPETTTPPTEPETTSTPTEPETTTPTEPDTTPPTTPEMTTPTEPETTTTPTPTEPEPTTTTTTEEPTTTTTTEEPTTTKRPKVTAPDTDCDEDDADCIIEDLGITPDWFVCPEDIGSYPHPSSRKLFIFCLNWKPSVKKCGQDLLYSEDLRTCVHP